MKPEDVEYIQSLKDVLREMDKLATSVDVWIKSDGDCEQAKVHERFYLQVRLKRRKFDLFSYPGLLTWSVQMYVGGECANDINDRFNEGATKAAIAYGLLETIKQMMEE